MTTTWDPLKVLELDISQPVQSITRLERYGGVYLLVRLRKQPVGWVYITTDHQPILLPEQIRQAINQQLGWQFVSLTLERQLIADNSPVTHSPISVIVLAIRQEEHLERCLHVLQGLDYPQFEVIVVTDKYQSALPKLTIPVRYLYRPEIGINQARNYGVSIAQYGLLAFINASAYPDSDWLQVISKTFSDPEVMALTGMVAPALLETETQIRFEFDFTGLGRGFRRWLLHRHMLTKVGLNTETRYKRNWMWRGKASDAELLWANRYGVGTNMACRRNIFNQIGFFEPMLDLPASALDHGATEFIHRILIGGCLLVYDPAALVWHSHPTDRKSGQQHIYNHGLSFGLYLLLCLRNRTLSPVSILWFVLIEWFGKWFVVRWIRPKKLPRSLILLELAGAIMSPFMFLAKQLQTKLNRPGHSRCYEHTN